MCENRLKIRDMVLCATMSLKKVIIVLLCRQIVIDTFIPQIVLFLLLPLAMQKTKKNHYIAK